MPSARRFDLLGPVRRFVGSSVSAAVREELARAKTVPERMDGPGWQSFYQNPNVFSVRGQAGEIKTPEQAYRYVSWVNRAIGAVIESSRRASLQIYKPRLSSQARSLGWSVKAKAAGDSLPPVSGPMDLLTNPLRDFSAGWDELFEQTLGHFLLRGWVGWYCPLGSGGRPILIQVIPRGAVSQIVIDGGKVVAFQVMQAGGSMLDIPVAQMCVFKTWNPDSPVEGLGKIEAVMLASDADRAQSQAVKDVARRGRYQDGVFSTDDPDYNAEDAKAARTMLESNYGGPENAYRAPILTGGLKWQRTGVTLRELDFMATRRFGREEIGGIFGVPPIRMGDWSNSYYNSREQSRAFWNDGIEPLLKRVKRFLDSQFLSYWDSSRGLACDWDTADIAELQDDRVELANLATQLVVNRIASPNKVRGEYFGWPPYPGGDDILAGLGMVPVGNDPAPKPESGSDRQRSDAVNDAYRQLLQATQPQARNRVKTLEIPDTAEALARWWKLLDSIMTPQARRLGGLVRARVLEDFLAPVSEAIRNHASDPTVVLDRRALSVKLADKSLPLVRSFYEQAGERAEGVAGAKALKFDLDAARLAKIHQMVEDWADATTDGFIKGTKDNILQALASGADLAASHDEIMAALKDVLGSEYRAEMASRTIIQGANNEATLQGWKSSGVVDGKRWLAGPPGPRRRPVHQEMSALGDVYALNEPFVLPDGATGQHPGDIALGLGNVVNCGCVQVAALKQLPS